MSGDSCVMMTFVCSVQWMMGNAVQCKVQQSVWCESQYEGRATSDGEWTEDHEPDS